VCLDGTVVEKVVRWKYVRLFRVGSVQIRRQVIDISEISVDATNEHGGVEVQLQTVCTFAANKCHISEACRVFLKHVNRKVCGYHRGFVVFWYMTRYRLVNTDVSE